MKTFAFLAATVAMLTSFVSADQGSFINNCQKAVYARSATCEDTGHESKLVQPGEVYDHNLFSTSPGCNRAIKIATSVEGLDSDCYNVEWVIDVAGILWYNLSHDHGDPVSEFRRTMAVDGCEDVIQCEPGDSSCDYPVLKNCNDQLRPATFGHVHFSLC